MIYARRRLKNRTSQHNSSLKLSASKDGKDTWLRIMIYQKYVVPLCPPSLRCPGGVIMDVMNKEQAKIAEEAGACAVMALERIPADIRQSKGVARMSDPKMIKDWGMTIPR